MTLELLARWIGSGILIAASLGILVTLAYDIVVSTGRKLGLMRRRGPLGRFVDWSLHKVFPRVDWPDDYGELRDAKWHKAHEVRE